MAQEKQLTQRQIIWSRLTGEEQEARLLSEQVEVESGTSPEVIFELAMIRAEKDHRLKMVRRQLQTTLPWIVVQADTKDGFHILGKPGSTVNNNPLERLWLGTIFDHGDAIAITFLMNQQLSEAVLQPRIEEAAQFFYERMAESECWEGNWTRLDDTEKAFWRQCVTGLITLLTTEKQ